MPTFKKSATFFSLSKVLKISEVTNLIVLFTLLLIFPVYFFMKIIVMKNFLPFIVSENNLYSDYILHITSNEKFVARINKSVNDYFLYFSLYSTGVRPVIFLNNSRNVWLSKYPMSNIISSTDFLPISNAFLLASILTF